MKSSKKISVSLGVLLFCITLGFAQTPRDLRYIEDMNYGAALREMTDRGYQLYHTNSSGSSIYYTYWNRDREKCVTLRSYSGRIESVVETPNSDCHKDRNGNDLSGDRSWDSDDRHYHHGDRNSHRYDDDRDHDRNYRYERGDVKVYDLTGMDALRAYDELRDRGFREQKDHQDDGKTYRVFYNYRTHQCIKTLSENKRIARVQNSTHCTY